MPSPKIRGQDAREGRRDACPTHFRGQPAEINLDPARIPRKNYLLTYQRSTCKQTGVKTKTASASARYQALLQLLRTSESLWNASRVFFDRWNLSPSQFNILNLLSLNPDGCTQVELSRLLIMHRSNITGLVDRLEKRHLLQRRDNPEDRRAYRVVLTPAGQKLIEKILPVYYAAAEEIWGNFPEARTKQLVGDLEKLSANIEAFPKTQVEKPT